MRWSLRGDVLLHVQGDVQQLLKLAPVHAQYAMYTGLCFWTGCAECDMQGVMTSEDAPHSPIKSQPPTPQTATTSWHNSVSWCTRSTVKMSHGMCLLLYPNLRILLQFSQSEN